MSDLIGTETEDEFEILPEEAQHGTGGGEDHTGEDGEDSDRKELVQGTDGPDDLTGTDADERFIMLGGNDTVRAAGGADAIIGGRDDDWLYGGEGDDEITGTEGTDVIFGEDGADTLDGGGRAGNYVEGGAGNDVITGGEGADVIYAGAGSDDITAGNGNDVVRITPGDATGEGDIIRDFAAGEDVLWIEGIDIASLAQTTSYDPETFDLRTTLTFSFEGSAEIETLTLIGLGFPDNEGGDVLLGTFLATQVETASAFDPPGPQESLDSSADILGFSQVEAEAGLEGGGEGGEGGGGGHGGGGGGGDHGGGGGDHGGGEDHGGEDGIDWYALGQMVTAYHAETGQWGDIDAWINEGRPWHDEAVTAAEVAPVAAEETLIG